MLRAPAFISQRWKSTTGSLPRLDWLRLDWLRLDWLRLPDGPLPAGRPLLGGLLPAGDPVRG
jgi:hypothetical protein